MAFDEAFLRQIADQTYDASWPRRGEVWRHYRGGVYTVLAVAVNEADGQPVVVYRNQQTGYVWTRPVLDWLATVEPTAGAVRVPRFQRVCLADWMVKATNPHQRVRRQQLIDELKSMKEAAVVAQDFDKAALFRDAVDQLRVLVARDETMGE